MIKRSVSHAFTSPVTRSTSHQGAIHFLKGEPGEEEAGAPRAAGWKKATVYELRLSAARYLRLSEETDKFTLRAIRSSLSRAIELNGAGLIVEKIAGIVWLARQDY